MNRMRKTVARLMSESKKSAPHFYLSMEVDMEAASCLLDDRNNARHTRISVTALMVRALAIALGEHPEINVHVLDEVPVPREDVSVGIAIATEDGLIAPALLDCSELSLEEVNDGVADLVERARGGRLRGRELTGASFTISNLGMYDVSAFTAIINPPQAAILATGTVGERVTAVDGEVAVRRMMTATLSADHRAVDGVEASAFLGRFRDLLEAPGELS
jgi:pyruvate dehydrogenase E2 component (dihydrolipoamide acetyltransferase)